MPIFRTIADAPQGAPTPYAPPPSFNPHAPAPSAPSPNHGSASASSASTSEREWQIMQETIARQAAQINRLTQLVAPSATAASSSASVSAPNSSIHQRSVPRKRRSSHSDSGSSSDSGSGSDSDSPVARKRNFAPMAQPHAHNAARAHDNADCCEDICTCQYVCNDVDCCYRRVANDPCSCVGKCAACCCITGCCAAVSFTLLFHRVFSGRWF